MKTIAVLKIVGQTFSVELQIEGMTSYWAAALSQKIWDCEYALAMRFQGICCSFWFDAKEFFSNDKQYSLCFAGKIDGVVANERVKNAMATTVDYLCKKLELELIRVDYSIK